MIDTPPGAVIDERSNLMRGTKLGAAALLAGAAILCSGTAAAAAPVPIAEPSGFGQIAAPVLGGAEALVGSVSAPLVNLNIPCPAPWQQGGVSGSAYNACNVVPIGG
ncbi:hypothetical protein [Kitasatospora arboriphila]|uniref:Chaplin domain-containing protein n=1 Tax=Kitasatospora arboriphila TaxID=258052 RepID=A0ABN1TLK0_9ACTN